MLFVFSILFGIFVTRVSNQLRMNVKMRAKYEADMVRATIQMLNAPRFACAKNLSSAGFGTTFPVFQAKSATGNIALLNPDVNAPANSAFFASGMRYLHLDMKVAVAPDEPRKTGKVCRSGAPGVSIPPRHYTDGSTASVSTPGERHLDYPNDKCTFAYPSDADLTTLEGKVKCVPR